MKAKGIWIVGLVVIVAATALGVRMATWNRVEDAKYLADQKKGFDERDQELAALQAKQQELVNQMKPAAGKGECKTDSQCRVAPLGVKICDGYKEFLVYSTADADVSTLMGLISNFNANETKLHDLSLTSKPCGNPTPVARCMNERCAVE